MGVENRSTYANRAIGQNRTWATAEARTVDAAMSSHLKRRHASRTRLCYTTRLPRLSFSSSLPSRLAGQSRERRTIKVLRAFKLCRVPSRSIDRTQADRDHLRKNQNTISYLPTNSFLMRCLLSCLLCGFSCCFSTCMSRSKRYNFPSDLHVREKELFEHLRRGNET